MFNSGIEFAQAGAAFLDLDGQNQSYKVIWSGLDGTEPDGHTGLAHELGHTFGLAHTTAVGVMNGWYGAIDAEYGQVAVHPNAFHKDALGWLAPERKLVALPGSIASFTLERLAMPGVPGYLMAQVPLTAPDADFYVVEARRSAGYDAGPWMGEGVLIYKVRWPPCVDLNYVASDIVGNSETSSIWWQPGETFVDTENGVTIAVDSQTSTGYDVTLQYLSGFSNRLYLPSVSRGGLVQPQPILCATQAWSADGEGVPRSSFAPGDSIVYDGLVVNVSPDAYLATVDWSAEGPCGLILSTSSLEGFGPGSASAPFPSSIPASACAGDYSYTLRVNYGGVDSSQTAQFAVIGE